MSRETQLWQFIATRLRRGESVILLVVAESSGSSPGRAGYKMAVAADGELCGSIGGGVMEVSLVELAKGKSKEVKGKSLTEVREQVHRKDAENASGMICSGKQTVVFKNLTSHDMAAVERAIDSIKSRRGDRLTISNDVFTVGPPEGNPCRQNTSSGNPTGGTHSAFERFGGDEFVYTELLGEKDQIYIIGGGHCSLALSEVMSRMNFSISIFDDRPQLNTIAKNAFADHITIIDSYDRVPDHIPSGDDVYVVVMTLGYASDAVVIRRLIDHNIKYLGVLGSRAKMATLMIELKAEGLDPDKLARIHTPIGVPINSRTPEEIAVSIAAEIIAVRNGAATRR